MSDAGENPQSDAAVTPLGAIAGVRASAGGGGLVAAVSVRVGPRVSFFRCACVSNRIVV